MANRYASILDNTLALNFLNECYPQDDDMYILIDTTNNQPLARHKDSMALRALHYIQFANVNAVLIGEGENKGWGQLEAAALVGVLQRAGYTGIVPAAYNELIKLTRKVTEACEWLLLPFAAQALNAQARSIDPDDGRPMRFNPNDTRPIVANAWGFAPQKLSVRRDSQFATEFIDNAAGIIEADALLPNSPRANVQVPIKGSNKREDKLMATAKKAAAKKAPAAKKAVAKKAPAVPKPPKAPAAAKAPAVPKVPKLPKAGKGDKTIEAPREGGTTRKVWDVCEALLVKKGSCPPFSAVFAKLGENVALATQRSTYAYWRRAKGFTGRVVE